MSYNSNISPAHSKSPRSAVIKIYFDKLNLINSISISLFITQPELKLQLTFKYKQNHRDVTSYLRPFSLLIVNTDLDYTLTPPRLLTLALQEKILFIM